MKRGIYILILFVSLAACSPRATQKQALFIAEIEDYSKDTVEVNDESVITFFEVELLDGFIEISWQTNSEDSIYFFEIEKAIGEEDYQTIFKINPFGNREGSDYLEIDESISYNQTLRYRLKTIQKYNQVYNDSVQIFIENPISNIDIFTHPTQRKQYIQFDGLIESNAEINLYHADGSLARSQDINIHKGNNEVEIPLQNQSGGVYYLHVKAPQKNWITRILNMNIPI